MTGDWMTKTYAQDGFLIQISTVEGSNYIRVGARKITSDSPPTDRDDSQKYFWTSVEVEGEA